MDMIYDVNSVLFRSFLASGGGSHGSGVRCSTHLFWLESNAFVG